MRTLTFFPILIAFASMTMASWRRWGDVLVDFGSQAYLPWQITRGRVLYRDDAWVFGPLSQYCNALLFKIFGVSLSTLMSASLVLVALLTWMLFEIFLKSADALAATVAAIVFLLCFAFGHYGMNGNYNYVFPYCYEVTHGLFLSVLAITLLLTGKKGGGTFWVSAAGFCVGLVFLTKPEIFVALATSSGMVFLLEKHDMHPRPWRLLLVFFGAALLPVVISFLGFLGVESPGAALRAPFMGWLALFTTRAALNSFYAWCLGLNEPLENALLMFKHTLSTGLFAGGCWLFCRWSSHHPLWRKAMAVIFPVTAFLGAFWIPWLDSGRALPILNLIICCHLAWRWHHEKSEKISPTGTALIWAVFSLTLLAKLGINSRIWHYGFVLAMPATLSVIHYFGWFLPLELGSSGINLKLFRGTVYAVLTVGVVQLAQLSLAAYQAKNYPVGENGDTLMGFPPEMDPRGLALNTSLAWLEKNSMPGNTLAALPEGAMINYLARRSNSTKYHAEVGRASLGFDELPMVQAFDAAKPDFFVLVHRDSSEFGVPFFGQAHDFGEQMMTWAERNYLPVHLSGNQPMRRPEDFGIQIFGRKNKNATDAQK